MMNFMKNLLPLNKKYVQALNYNNDLKEQMSLMHKLKDWMPKPQGFKMTWNSLKAPQSNYLKYRSMINLSLLELIPKSQ
ncbi:UNKNOWN [Stylonychia lemnae]|uniref:Uncharacterized protein n=1 Tax=Stylonychia lemnae TaxID=5949 RepID=A0A077ZY97_STYLE|nr:UNKNOWN [Stylonychia lemnae]|eukprot:CDW73526.1 UNKNOWN [Stylonychia lemnae]